MLKYGSRPEAGVEYAYELVRQHFSEPEAHEVYIATIGIGDEMVASFVDPDKASAGGAVNYRIDDSAEEKWIIIENSPDPKQERGEVSAGHTLAQEVTEEGVGESFLYRRDLIQNRTATILAVISKYAYRKLDIISTWEDRFPDVPFVRKYTIPKKEDGAPDISLILRALDLREKQAEQLHELYHKHPLSLATFARVSTTSLFESLVHLASDNTLSVRCCLGSREEFQRDRNAFETAECLVIDSSALATLFFSDHIGDLSLLPKKLIVCESALQEFRDLARKLEAGASGFFGKSKGQYVFRDDNPQDREQQRQRVADFLAKVQALLSVTSGQYLLDVDPDVRKELIDMFGRPIAEAIAAATQKGAVLWSDDLGVAEFARHKIGVRRVWTQLVFSATKTIAQDAYADVTIFLLQWNYNFTRLEPEIVVEACKRASWEPDAFPLKTVIKWFGAGELQYLAAINVCARSLPLVWRYGPLIHMRENVTRAFARAIFRQTQWP